MLNPYYIDGIWLLTVFLSGLAFKKMNLPPLIGFLLTGIILNYSGFVEGNLYEVLDALSNLGIMLLLFTIGLKIKVNDLIRKNVLLQLLFT